MSDGFLEGTIGLKIPKAVKERDALVEILLLGMAIAATSVAFRRISEAAFWLMAPYLIWVGFAAYLNFRIWRLNA